MNFKDEVLNEIKKKYKSKIFEYAFVYENKVQKTHSENRLFSGKHFLDWEVINPSFLEDNPECPTKWSGYIILENNIILKKDYNGVWSKDTFDVKDYLNNQHTTA